MAKEGVEAPTTSLFRAAYYQRIPLVLQQLNFAEWPQFCDHSVSSADVRLSVGPNLSPAACQRPVDLRQSQAWTGGHQHANPRLLPVYPSPAREDPGATFDR